DKLSVLDGSHLHPAATCVILGRNLHRRYHTHERNVLDCPPASLYVIASRLGTAPGPNRISRHLVMLLRAHHSPIVDHPDLLLFGRRLTLCLVHRIDILDHRELLAYPGKLQCVVTATA